MDARFVDQDWELRKAATRHGNEEEAQGHYWIVPGTELRSSSGLDPLFVGVTISAAVLSMLVFLPLPHGFRVLCFAVATPLWIYALLHNTRRPKTRRVRQRVGSTADFHKQVTDLIFALQDFHLTTGSAEQRAHENPRFFIDHESEIERIYRHPKNPLATPARRHLLAEYIRDELSDELDIARKTQSEIEDILKTYWEADHLSLLVAKSIPQPPQPLPPESLAQQIERALSEVLDYQEGIAKLQGIADAAPDQHTRQMILNHGNELLRSFARQRATASKATEKQS